MADAQGAGGPLLSRRTLLGTAAAITAAGALGARPGRAEAATGLLRIVDLGQGATLHPGSPADLRVGDNRALLAESGTAAVRLWADWPMPAARPGARRPATPRAPARRSSRRSTARSRRPTRTACEVVLQFYRFPLWANGTAELAAVRGTDAEISFAYADRIAPAAWAVRRGRPRPGGLSPSPAGARVRRPGRGLRPRHSAWAAYVRVPARALPARRRPARSSTRFELVNEPNFQFWPQRAPSPTADPFALGPRRRAAHRRRDDGRPPVPCRRPRGIPGCC